jgi:uncharacterized membrane protein
MKDEEQVVKDEMRREFALERMILFSDAVFAIVITLMALELRIPHNERLTYEKLTVELVHLIPVFAAYMGGFFFIGATWFHHLRYFGLLKTYDRGLVVRNLMLLFFIGLFPFSASLVSTVSEGMMLPIAVYFAVVLLCTFSQLRLQHYILHKPALRLHHNISEEMHRFKISRIVFLMLLLMFVLISTTFYLIPDPHIKSIAWWWFFIFPFIMKIAKKRIKKAD